MAKCDEVSVAALLGRETGVKFSGSTFHLGGWGQVDDYAKLDHNRYLFLEVETGQKHPDTNVLKVWPYIEANPKVSVVLAQAFFPDSPGYSSNRGKLGCWLGNRLEGHFGPRFRYHRLIIAPDSCGVVEGLKEIRASMDSGG